MKPPHAAPQATAQQSITGKRTVAMMQLMQMQGIPYPTTTLAHAVIRLLNSIYEKGD